MANGGKVSSVTQRGLYEPFELQVARGQIALHESFQLFGYNPDLDQTEESVWANGGVVPHPTVASVLKISSTSTADDGNPAGTGAQTVLITGVDGDYNVVSETVALNGQTAVNTQNSYLYVNGFTVLTVGSGGVNAGAIYAGTGDVTTGVPAVVYDVIGVGYNNRTTAHYCVPAGYTAYVTEGIFTAGQPTGSTGVTGYLKYHGPDGVLRVGAVTALNNGAVQYDFAYPLRIPEKNCFGASAIGSENNNLVSAFFNVVLIRNEYEISNG
jgi:hypothetical protein